MKKIIFALLIALIALPSFGAASEDLSTNIYVRQDVFDAKMEALLGKIHGEFVEFKNEIKSEIGDLKGDIRVISTRMDALEKRMGGLETVVTWILGLLSVVVAAIALTPLLREMNKPKFTLDDVRRLIEENNAKLIPNLQV